MVKLKCKTCNKATFHNMTYNKHYRCIICLTERSSRYHKTQFQIARKGRRRNL